MIDQPGQRFLTFACPLCEGTGVVNGQACNRCSRHGVFGWLDGDFLYWGKRIDTLHIFEEEIERLVTSIINGFLVLFGVVGIGAAFVTMYALIQEGKPFWDFIFQRNGLMGIFAITLITDLYAYYRMQRASLLDDTVKQHAFDPVRTEAEPQELFDQFQSANKEHTINVADAYTTEAGRAIADAWRFAKKLNHPYATPLHLLASLFTDNRVRVVLGRLGINGKELAGKISRSLSKIPLDDDGTTDMGADMNRVLIQAYEASYESRLPRVDVPQLLEAIVLVHERAREIFYDMEVEVEDIQNVIEWININRRMSEKWRTWRGKAAHKSKTGMNKAMTAQATPLLDRFSHDLTQLARRGALAPTIGREKETEEALRIIEGGKNVIFSGNPGVGKTSIVQGIAELMASEEVPSSLQDKRLVSLSVASLVGAAGRQGELEGLMMQLINEIVRSGNIVLYIDNIQNMVGVSTQGAENLDIAEILANALQKNLFYCVATTSPIDYRRYIEQSSTLMSVFQKVNVPEPDANGTIRILEGKAGIVESKNQVFFSYEALSRIVALTERYVQDRFQPEKSISILEEVGVYTRKRKGKNAIVSGEDVAEVISSKTNVPVTKITEKESEKLLNLEERIHERMVNQEEAVTAVSTALRRARAELRDVRRPIVNLLFLGPTGVGKTELAKTVAEVYFNSEENMIRLDMSEYQEKSSINRLIGAPPGYAGAGAGGYLTEAIRAKPFSLVLLDELEKAHPDILNIFLQVMDDGRLTDTVGRTVDFSNVILIATSNAGTDIIQQRMKEKKQYEEIKQELINKTLQPYFRPEFLNRFDNIVVFRPLSIQHIVQIVDLMLEQVERRLGEKGIRLQATQAVKEELAREGYDPQFGARPLRRAIQEKVDNALANYLLQGKIGRRDIAVLETGGQIRVERAEPL